MSYRSIAPANITPVLRYCAQIEHTIIGATPEDRAKDAANAAKASNVSCEPAVECNLAHVHMCADRIIAEVP